MYRSVSSKIFIPSPKELTKETTAPVAASAAVANPPIAILVRLMPPVVFPNQSRDLRALLISSVNLAVSASSLIFKLLI